MEQTHSIKEKDFNKEIRDQVKYEVLQRVVLTGNYNINGSDIFRACLFIKDTGENFNALLINWLNKNCSHPLEEKHIELLLTRVSDSYNQYVEDELEYIIGKHIINLEAGSKGHEGLCKNRGGIIFMQVIRAEDNKSFIQKKSHTIVTDNKDGTGTVRRNIDAVSDRIWLDEEFSGNYGMAYKYKLKFANQLCQEGFVVEKGKDEYGHYLLFLNSNAFMNLHNKEERPHIPCGPAEMSLILAPEMIEGSDELVKGFKGSWPSFHEARIRIIEKSLKSMILEFYGGFLSHRVVRLFIEDIISQSYDQNCLENFEELTSLEFRKAETHMEVLLLNDYTTHRLPEGFDNSVFKNDPEFDTNTIEWVIEEYQNHGVISCEKLKMMVTIDEEQKQLQAFLRHF